jgi:hypothetical protein
VKTNPQFQLLRVKTAVANVPVINIYSPFTRDEIIEAKLRMMNKEYYFEKEKDELEKKFVKEDREIFELNESSIDRSEAVE